MASSGKLTPNDQVRLDGTEDWLEASSIQGLFVQRADKATPPPIPQPFAGSSRLKETFDAFRVEATTAASEKATKAASKAAAFLNVSPDESGTIREAGLSELWAVFRRLPPIKKIALLSPILLLSCAFLCSGIVSTGGALVGSPLAIGGKGQLDMTIGEFRDEIWPYKKVLAKDEFYDKYGKPKKVTTLGNTTYLIYECTDGTCRVECNASVFQGRGGTDAQVLIFSVNET